MIELKEWITDGIDIRKIKELDELTPDKFKEMVERQKHFRELEAELLSKSFGAKIEQGLFKDLFD